MTFLNVKNRAFSTLASGISDSDLSLTVASGEGVKFPASNFHITIDDEILLCTSRTTDTFTVERAKEDTVAAAHSSGAKVELRITAKIIDDLKIAATLIKGFSVSANLRNSNDTERNSTATSYTKLKEVKLNEDLGAATLKFTLGAGNGGEDWGYAQVYKNGVAIGTERSNNNVDGIEYSENFTEWVAGDLIQIYARCAYGKKVFVKNMRFYFDYNLTKIGVETLTTPLEVSELPLDMTNQDP